MNLNAYAAQAHADNAQWWIDLKTGMRLVRNKGELLMLAVSEIAEAMEGERKGLMDDHLPCRRMAEVKLADASIRLFDYAGAFKLDLDKAYADLLGYAGYAGEPTPGDLDNYRNQARALRLIDFGNAHLTGDFSDDNRGARLLRIVAEICAAAEYAGFERGGEVEAEGVLSALIAIFDYAGKFGFEIEAPYREKRAFNLNRPDHKPAARLAAGGKSW